MTTEDNKMKTYWGMHTWLVRAEILYAEHDRIADEINRIANATGGLETTRCRILQRELTPAACPVCHCPVTPAAARISANELYGEPEGTCRGHYACPCCGVRIELMATTMAPWHLWVSRLTEAQLDLLRGSLGDTSDHATRDEINEARERYGSDELDFDELPRVSRSDEGTWVNAWVWLPKDEDEDARQVTITVEGGCVQDVDNLPPGYSYHVEDRDVEDDEDEIECSEGQFAAFLDTTRSRRFVRVHFANGDTIDTEINGTKEEIVRHYAGSVRDFGDTDEHPASDPQRVTSIEFRDVTPVVQVIL